MIHMPNSLTPPPLFLYSTTVSDVGTVRSNNQDSSFAGEHLVAICDGMGGHAGGDTASTIAIRSLAHIEQDDVHSDVRDVSSMMETSVMAAHDAIVGKAKRERTLAGMGTTVTAVALVEGYWILAHIGDSRAYMLRDGVLSRMTTDHSYVQHLIDTGRITEAEARNHPQRNVVMRVLGDFDIDPRPDIAMFKARPADRWMLCSDGLCGVLEDSTIEERLSHISDQNECAQQLVTMALKAGSTDNVTAVIADSSLALDANAFDLPHQTPLIGGAAENSLEPIADIVKEPVASAPRLRHGKDPAQRAAELTQDSQDTSDEAPRIAQPSSVREQIADKGDTDTGEIPVVQKKDGRLSADPNDPEVAKAIRHEQAQQRLATRKRSFKKHITMLIAVLVLIAAAAAAGLGAYRWSQSKYYLGNGEGVVSIYQGVNTNIFGFKLSHEVEDTDIKTSELPQAWSDQLDEGIAVDSLEEAHSHVKLIEREIERLQKSKDTDTSNTDTTTDSSKKSGTSDSKSTSSAGPSSSASSSASASPSSSSSTKGDNS
jgi:protein phosphatase